MNADKTSAQLWKSQHRTITGRAGVDINMDSLSAELDKAERRNRALTLFKVIAGGTGILLLSFSWLLLPPDELSWMTVTGSLVIGAVAVAFLVGFWRNRPLLHRLDRSLPAEQFVRRAIDALSRQQSFFKSWFPWVIGTLVIAANFIFAGVMQEEPLWERWTVHLSMTALLIGEAFLGVRFRKRVFIRKDLELLERLRKVLQDLQAEEESRNG